MGSHDGIDGSADILVAHRVQVLLGGRMNSNADKYAAVVLRYGSSHGLNVNKMDLDYQCK